MPNTPGGSHALDIAITDLNQVTIAVAAVGALIELGVSIKNRLRSAGKTTEQADAAIAKFDAAIAPLVAENAAWRDSHPRTTDA
jgi:hypothetical protein